MAGNLVQSRAGLMVAMTVESTAASRVVLRVVVTAALSADSTALWTAEKMVGMTVGQ